MRHPNPLLVSRPPSELLRSSDHFHPPVPVKEVEEDVVPDVVPAPEAVESASVEEETPVATEPKPESDSKSGSNGVEPPLSEDVGVVVSPEIPPFLSRAFLIVDFLKVEDNKDESAPTEGLPALPLDETIMFTLRRTCS